MLPPHSRPPRPSRPRTPAQAYLRKPPPRSNAPSSSQSPAKLCPILRRENSRPDRGARRSLYDEPSTVGSKRLGAAIPGCGTAVRLSIEVSSLERAGLSVASGRKPRAAYAEGIGLGPEGSRLTSYRPCWVVHGAEAPCVSLCRVPGVQLGQAWASNPEGGRALLPRPHAVHRKRPLERVDEPRDQLVPRAPATACKRLRLRTPRRRARPRARDPRLRLAAA